MLKIMGKKLFTIFVSKPTNSFSFQIFVSKKWGFTKWPREKYTEMRSNYILIPDGVTVQYKPDKGPLSAWKARMEKVH